jgi:hypothetical protein
LLRQFKSEETDFLKINYKSTAVLLIILAMTPKWAIAADGRPSAHQEDSRSLMAIAPPTIPLLNVAHGEYAQSNPAQIMEQVIPRVAKDGEKQKWPFKIMTQETISGVYAAATGAERKPDEEIKFGDLKHLADKVGCRYIVVFTVTELTSRYFMAPSLLNATPALTARAAIDLKVYDHDENKFIFRTTAWCETRHPQVASKDVGLRREQDGSLNGALTKAPTPFAKGERNTVETPKLNIVVTVSKVLTNGKLLLDAGRTQNVSIGMNLASIESDAVIKIVEVLDNGSVAEVVSGKPKEKEVFKPK